MKEKNILDHTLHRPWPLPIGSWSYYQEWNNAIFLHWKVPSNLLEDLIPKNIVIDKLEGDAWVSLVAFTMENIRPKNLPSISLVSNFHEINVRTYVTKNSKPGVYFLNIEAQKIISAWMAKSLSGLPYEKATIAREINSNKQSYLSENARKKLSLKLNFVVEESIKNKTELDKWLTERYCLYQETQGQLYRYEIHHNEWELKKVRIIGSKVDYRIGNLSLHTEPDLVHYSPGVQVFAWKREYISISGTSL